MKKRILNRITESPVSTLFLSLENVARRSVIKRSKFQSNGTLDGVASFPPL